MTTAISVTVAIAEAAAGLFHDSQDNWRWCNKCQGLTFAGNPTPGVCPAKGNHDHSGSGNYRLFQNTTSVPGQDNWHWCTKCQGLAYGGSGACAAGGMHDHTGSGNYVLVQNLPTSLPLTQDNWRWCDKCQALTFGGNSTLGACPAGGTHDHAGSGNYVLIKT
jgi:hypothetical protein